jgi:hypothetical protein
VGIPPVASEIDSENRDATEPETIVDSETDLAIFDVCDGLPVNG